MANGFENIFSKEDRQMAKKQMKVLNTISHEGKAAQKALWTHETAKVEQTIPSVGGDVDKLVPSDTAGGTASWCSRFGKQLAGTQKS